MDPWESTTRYNRWAHLEVPTTEPHWVLAVTDEETQEILTVRLDEIDVLRLIAYAAQGLKADRLVTP